MTRTDGWRNFDHATLPSRVHIVILLNCSWGHLVIRNIINPERKGGPLVSWTRPHPPTRGKGQVPPHILTLSLWNAIIAAGMRVVWLLVNGARAMYNIILRPDSQLDPWCQPLTTCFLSTPQLKPTSDYEAIDSTAVSYVPDPLRDTPRPRSFQRCPGGVLRLPHCHAYAPREPSVGRAVRPSLSLPPAAFDGQQCRQLHLQLQSDIPAWVGIYPSLIATEVTKVSD